MRDPFNDIQILERGSGCLLVAGSILDLGRVRSGAELFDLAAKCLIALFSVKVFQVELSSRKSNSSWKFPDCAPGR